MAKRWLVVAGLLGGVGVALGAFGAHGLRFWLPLQKVTIFETAVRYHLFHTLALFGTAILLELFPARAAGLGRVAWLFLGGLLLFSGSLYAYALTDLRVFAWVTPVGGVAWMLAWFALAWVLAERGK